MLIAGEASGDTLGAELIAALKSAATAQQPTFFGAGGPRMQAAGMELIFDFTSHAIFGAEAFGRLLEFRRRMQALLALAIERKPDVIIGVDFSGFNRRFAHMVKEHVRSNPAANWDPKIVQYVSPQVWASRPGRANLMVGDVDLLLSIFPFERAWYAKRTPALRVEFVGHPMVDRYAGIKREQEAVTDSPLIVFLPGSRPSELKRHLPIMTETWNQIRAAFPKARAVTVLPERLIPAAREAGLPAEFVLKPNLTTELAHADLAIAKSGTVTLECAWFGVPTVVMYKASFFTYVIAKCIMHLKWVAMPNILANDEIFPEFVRTPPTTANIAPAALELLRDSGRRNTVKAKLAAIAASLGQPGAAQRAAAHILRLLEREVAAS